MSTPKYGDLVQGQEYFTVVCSNDACQAIIPIAPAGEMYTPIHGRKLTIGCPFCGKTGEVPLDDAEIRQLDILTPTAK
jgi:hypothetical protein